MGQKVNPIGLRTGIIRDWQSRWYASDKEYGKFLKEDMDIRNYLNSELKAAFVSRIEIERSKNRIEIIIRAVRPGVVIGQNGENIDRIKKALEKQLEGNTIHVKVLEIANPDLDALTVARNIAEQLENRASFRSTQKRAIQRTMRAGAKGVKTLVSGRLGGADMARSEGYSEGIVPLHTLRSDIDYAHYEANTTFGKLGVKVWVCRGEVLPGQMVVEPEAPKHQDRNRRPRRRRRDDRRRPAQNTGSQQENKTVETKSKSGGN